MPISSQVKLVFDKLDEKGLQPVVKKFEQKGYKIIQVDANNRARRESGFAIKNFTLTFEDEQKLLVRVKGDGTVFQVKLNNRVMPVKHVDDIDKAISEMCMYLYDNAKTFERSKKQRERRKKVSTEKPRTTTSRAEKIASYQEYIKTIEADMADMTSQVKVLKEDLEAKTSELDQTNKLLEAEYKRTNELNAEIRQVKAELEAA